MAHGLCLSCDLTLESDLPDWPSPLGLTLKHEGPEEPVSSFTGTLKSASLEPTEQAGKRLH